jgi:cbb3-type cytochrome oxidase subunit 3
MTPDTSSYYYAAYAVMSLLLAGYVVSLWWRAKKARPEP